MASVASRLLGLVGLLGRLGPDARAWLEFHSGRRRFFDRWGGPMNDQTARLDMVSALVHALQPVQIIETGTYRGTTTEWLARFGVPVVTIEAEPLAFHFSRRRLARFGHVRVVLGDSVGALRELPPDDRAVFCYLDAHTPSATPLRDELTAIVERMPRATVLIDDFAIPDDPGYGANAGIDLEALAVPTTRSVFLPAVPSRAETGHRRGAAVVTWDAQLAARLSAIPLLRPWPGVTGRSSSP